MQEISLQELDRGVLDKVYSSKWNNFLIQVYLIPPISGGFFISLDSPAGEQYEFALQVPLPVIHSMEAEEIIDSILSAIKHRVMCRILMEEKDAWLKSNKLC